MDIEVFYGLKEEVLWSVTILFGEKTFRVVDAHKVDLQEQVSTTIANDRAQAKIYRFFS